MKMISFCFYSQKRLKKIQKPFLLIILLFGLFGTTNAQFQSGTILLKFYKSSLAEFYINPELNDLMQYSSGSMNAIFPYHHSLEQPTNERGDSLVDLSLWYQLEYTAAIPEFVIVRKLKSTGLFQYVEQRPLNKLFYVPNDPMLGNQFYLNNIRAYDAWNLEKGDSNVVVGVTDTGIDRIHVDLKKGIKYNYQDTIDGLDNDNDGFIDNFCGWDVGSNDNNVQWGPIGHGTFVAGFVSAVPDNAIGIAGVGFHIKTLPVKIDDVDGVLIHDYEGIVYAADHDCAVINCSWGGPVFTQFGKDVVNYATFNRNTLVVAACGNSNNAGWMYPASYENVLSVAATDSMDVRWSQSSYGSNIDISAPGTFVYSTWVNNGYLSSHGTSFSAPMVAAAAALVKSHFPSLTALQLGEQLRVSADIIDTITGNIPTKDLMGAGRLNIYKALIDTLKPSIRFSNREILGMEKTQVDTLTISGKFTNFLAPSSNALMATISCNSPYIKMIDSVFQIGSLASMGDKNNLLAPFRIKILQGIPFAYKADIKITYSDTNYQGFEFFRLELNKDFTVIDTNKIALSLTSKSRLGFNDDFQNQGIGMLYKGGRSMLSIGGLLLATSSSRVSDNIYGEQSYDHDFRALVPIYEVANPSKGDQAFYTEYNDDSAGFGKQYLKVKQFSYAYKQAGKEKFVILEYHIFNTAATTISGLYTALFMDFDIEKSSANKAAYDASQKMAYTYQVAGGKMAGISLLEGTNPNVYNIDNNGSNGSVSVYGGFYGFEKFQAMTQQRDSAAYGIAGGDVSNLISSGPYSLASGDSIVVAYAVLVGDYLSDLKQSSQEAYDTYYNTASMDERYLVTDLILYDAQPNPFSEQTRIRFYNPKRQKLKLSVYDTFGRLVKELTEGVFSEGMHQLNFSSKDLSKGVYYLKLSTSQKTLSKKVVLY
jgi:hypothetical protein